MKGLLIIIYLAVLILQIVATWKVFVKAGQPGWASIIPFCLDVCSGFYFWVLYQNQNSFYL